MIKDVTLQEALSLNYPHDALILRGCGGDPVEWLDGINDLLKEEGILQENRFQNLIRFTDEHGLICLVYDLSEPRLNIGRLALWRLTNGAAFSGVWFSDFRDQHTTEEEEDL